MLYGKGMVESCSVACESVQNLVETSHLGKLSFLMKFLLTKAERRLSSYNVKTPNLIEYPQKIQIRMA